MTHACLWPGCRRAVPAELAMCREHWVALPEEHRRAVRGAYSPGQDASTASPAWHRAISEVQGWVAKTFGADGERARQSWGSLVRAVRARDEARRARRASESG